MIEILFILGIIVVFIFIISGYENLKFKYKSATAPTHEDKIIFMKPIRCSCGKELKGWYRYGNPSNVKWDICVSCDNKIREYWDHEKEKREKDLLNNMGCLYCKITTNTKFCPQCGNKCYYLNTCVECGYPNHSKHCVKCGGKVVFLG